MRDAHISEFTITEDDQPALTVRVGMLVTGYYAGQGREFWHTGLVERLTLDADGDPYVILRDTDGVERWVDAHTVKLLGGVA
jgi:hypothetical protein